MHGGLIATASRLSSHRCRSEARADRALADDWFSSDSGVSGRAKRCARTAPSPRSRSLPPALLVVIQGGRAGLDRRRARSRLNAGAADVRLMLARRVFHRAGLAGQLHARRRPVSDRRGIRRRFIDRAAVRSEVARLCIRGGERKRFAGASEPTSGFEPLTPSLRGSAPPKPSFRSAPGLAAGYSALDERFIPHLFRIDGRRRCADR
jgi:hypothetical protein